MSPSKVRVSKDYTVFCSGHFITYEGDKCESLHGHNYRAAVTVEGDLNESAYVFDFSALKMILRTVCDRLDHKMLLPQHNPLLKIIEENKHITVNYREKVYCFPSDDVVMLPIPNTTAEKLAAWISNEIETILRERGAQRLTVLEIEVEESFGQSAFYRKSLV